MSDEEHAPKDPSKDASGAEESASQRGKDGSPAQAFDAHGPAGAGKDDSDSAPAASQAKEAQPDKPHATQKGHAGAFLCAVLGAALGVALTLVVTGGVGGAAGGASAVTVDGDAREGTTAVTLEELPDTIVGSYSYEGQTTDISAGDVVALYVGVNNDVSDDDSSLYKLPSADYVLSFARASILDKVAQEQGFDASDDECLDYVRQLLGDDSVTYDTASRQLGLSVDEIKKIAAQTVRVQKLQQSVTGFDAQQPAEPDAPADDEVPSGGTAADVAKSDYRDYVLALVGDAYDPDTNTWADDSSEYASALADYDLSASEYTYGCAEAAYSVAANDYYTNASDANSAWDAYVADIYSKASVRIYTLAIS